MTKAGMGIHELQQLVGVPIRTIHHWTKKRVLSRPIGHGRSAYYTEHHVLCAKAIKHLRHSKQSLRDIDRRIRELSDEQLRALVPDEGRAMSNDGVPIPPPPTTYPFRNWELVSLTKGLFLIVDPTEGPLIRRIADEIYKYYGVKVVQ